jgi:2-polyprenyl-3-methyl-5-hydroxy-6-metoxy-1,4-benzoquinol methylase
MDIVDVNRDYYNKLYKRKHPLVSLIYSFISFDQQSKSKVNFREVKKYFGNRFTNNLAILDYGFGHGSLLLKFRSNHKLYGCDISEEAVFSFPAVAKLIGKNATTITVSDFDWLPAETVFDVISLSHIIEHVDDDASLVTKLSGRLSQEGIMLINVPINEVWEDPKHVRKYDQHYLEQLLQVCQLHPIAFTECDRLTSFFLREEKTKRIGRLKLLYIKGLRFAFAILPLQITRSFEKLFLKGHADQQLTVLAKRI